MKKIINYTTAYLRGDFALKQPYRGGRNLKAGRRDTKHTNYCQRTILSFDTLDFRLWGLVPLLCWFVDGRFGGLAPCVLLGQFRGCRPFPFRFLLGRFGGLAPRLAVHLSDAPDWGTKRIWRLILVVKAFVILSHAWKPRLRCGLGDEFGMKPF